MFVIGIWRLIATSRAYLHLIGLVLETPLGLRVPGFIDSLLSADVLFLIFTRVTFLVRSLPPPSVYGLFGGSPVPLTLLFCFVF